MTYEETIYKIKGKIGLQADCVLESDQERQVVWEALEKQIPEKPKEIMRIKEECYANGRCTKCDTFVTIFMRYCDRCGQKLDWSEEK